jgi:hypothetical protein
LLSDSDAKLRLLGKYLYDVYENDNHRACLAPILWLHQIELEDWGWTDTDPHWA